MKFPAHFPEGCPPANVNDASGEVFRFVKNDPLDANEFLSYFALGKPLAPDQLCQACGLSVLVSEHDVKEVRRVSPWFKKRKVAKARISPEWGKIAPTASKNVPNHHTWWIPDGKEPVRLFVIANVT
jgi:hypothetical protein